MYKEFFRLERYPFHNTPDPAFFFSSRGHREALASMVYGIQEGKGFTLVTGDVGTGKTMLVQALKNELGEQHILIEIANPWVTPEEVFNAVRQRIKATAAEDEALLDNLKKRLLLLAKKGQRVVLIIDEAHQLPERTLEGIRLLSNIETSTDKLLQIVLLGQDELASMLSLYSMRQVQQRIAMSVHLQRLTLNETAEYIQHRLRIAGGTGGLFPPNCVELVYRETAGSPRVINQLCDSALLFAFGRRCLQVTPEIVQDAIASLHPERRVNSLIAGTAGPSSLTTPATPSAAPTPPAAEPVATAPATADASAEALPFSLPSAHPHRAPPVVSASSAPGMQRWFPVLMLLAGLALGGGGLFYFQKSAGPEPQGGGKKTSGAPPASTHPAAAPVVPPPQTPPTLTTPPPALTAPPVAPPPAAARTQSPPLPGQSDASLAMREATIPQQGSLSMLASGEYGGWNETIRDLVVAANPKLHDPENVPSGTAVMLPVLTRESLVVRDSGGRFHVYFGSFDKADQAQANLEAIRRTWPDAQLVAAIRQGTAVQRLFVGAFASRNDALAVANSLWLKHLPRLN